MAWGKLNSGKDRVLANAEKSSASEILAELIWNSIDADADLVDVEVEVSEFGAPTEVRVSDNGHGIDPDLVNSLFLTEGDSWKATKRFSPKGRPLHGKLGRGRLLVYGIAEAATWSSTWNGESRSTLQTIEGTRSDAAGFEITSTDKERSPSGTEVRLRLRDSQKAARIADGNFHLQIVERLAETLTATETRVNWQGTPLDASALVDREEELDIGTLDAQVLMGHPQPTVRVVEWSEDVGSKRLLLCSRSGAAVASAESGIPQVVPFSWSCYVNWDGFGDAVLMTVADLHVPEVRHNDLLTAVRSALATYLDERLETERGRIVAEWKDAGVYPYPPSPPLDQAEATERNIFDIVAVMASKAIPKTGTQQRKLPLRLLRDTLCAEPTRLKKALLSVVGLSEEDAEMLDFLLQRTELGSIIRSSNRIASRLEFVRGLGDLLYADETRTTFREVDQLHPMLLNESWVFGDEWDGCYSEHGLTKVVKAAVEKNGGLMSNTPVKLESGRAGRLDMLFHKNFPESTLTRHLVVELKRPMKLTMNEFGQLSDYAVAITGHPEVKDLQTKWDFWLVGTEMNEAVRAMRDGASAHLGFCKDHGSYRTWVITWTELLDALRARFEWYRKELSVVPTSESSKDYLSRKHHEYIPDTSEPRQGARGRKSKEKKREGAATTGPGEHLELAPPSLDVDRAIDSSATSIAVPASVG